MDNCGCEIGIRLCREAEALWQRAGAYYQSGDWLNYSICRAKYAGHMQMPASGFPCQHCGSVFTYRHLGTRELLCLDCLRVSEG